MAYYDSHDYNLESIGPQGPYGPLVGQRMDGRGVLGGVNLGSLGALGSLGGPGVMGRSRRRSMSGYDEDLAVWTQKRDAFLAYQSAAARWAEYDRARAAWDANQRAWAAYAAAKQAWEAKDRAWRAYSQLKVSHEAAVAAWESELRRREAEVAALRKNNMTWAAQFKTTLPPPGTSICMTAADRAALSRASSVRGLGGFPQGWFAANAQLAARLASCPAYASGGTLATNMGPRPTANLVAPPWPGPPPTPPPANGPPPTPPAGERPAAVPNPGPPPAIVSPPAVRNDALPVPTDVTITNPVDLLPPGGTLPPFPGTLPGGDCASRGMATAPDGSCVPLPPLPGGDCASRGMATAPDGSCIPSEPTEKPRAAASSAGGLGSTGLLLLLAAAGGAAYWYSQSGKKKRK